MSEKLLFKEVFWEDVREEIKKVNPILFKIIEKLSPDKRYPLIKASYKFGDLVVQDGLAQLPNSVGNLIPITSKNLPVKLKNQLAYSPIPLFLVLKNTNEVFVKASSRVIPLNIFYPGKLLGLFETLDYLLGRQSSSRWCVSAGARNLLTLPKISEELGFKRLKMAFDLDSNLRPRYLSDHWALFSHIAQHKNFDQKWENEILFFTKNWFENHSNNSQWLAFKDYLFQTAWNQSQFAISRVGLNNGKYTTTRYGKK